jgi:hypothetical protein
VLEGAAGIILAGRIRNILFGVYQDHARRREQLEASERITAALSLLGYVFYDVYDCGRGGHGAATCPGPRQFANTTEVLRYLRRERAEGWHAMLLASLPGKAELDLEQAGLSKQGLINVLAGSAGKVGGS